MEVPEAHTVIFITKNQNYFQSYARNVKVYTEYQHLLHEYL